MRKLIFLGTSLMVFLFSCKEKTVTDSVPTSLKISLDKTSILADGVEKATVTVKDQDGNNVTATTAVYFRNANSATSTVVYNSGSSLSFDFSQIGSYKIFATKYGVSSDTTLLTAANPGAAKYSSKVLIESFTANWAGWCPRTSYKLDAFAALYPNLCIAAIHNNDVFYNRVADSTLRYKYSIAAAPTMLVDRNYYFQENGDITNLADSTQFTQFLKKRAVLGLALNTSFSGNTLSVTAKTGFDATISDSLKLIVYVVENGLVAPQRNYYYQNSSYPTSPYFNPSSPFINKNDTITNFVHNYVYRASGTTVLGTTIPVDKQVKNGEYSTTYSFDVSSYNKANLKVIAFVCYADSQVKTGLLNSQWVTAGQNKNYD